MPQRYSIVGEDLEHIASCAEADLRTFHSARFFMTGCTGFLGRWLIEGLLWANERLSLDLHLCVLTRSAEHFLDAMPHLRAHNNLKLLEGCVTALIPEQMEKATHIIHGANLPNDGSAGWPLARMRVAYEGTLKVLEFARMHHTSAMLLMSSGAVYAPGRGEGGPPFIDKENGPEDYLNEPNVYANCKYFEELLSVAYGEEHGIRIPIARCFTFMGAHMPLHERQALSSFFNDALHNRDIVIQGDGTSVRSYMYAADMAIWIFSILARGKHATAYNVGSDKPINIATLAADVIKVSEKKLSLKLLHKYICGNAPIKYVPLIKKMQKILSHKRQFSFHNGIEATWKHVIKYTKY